LKRGVNAWIYPSSFNFESVLHLSKTIGFDGVELNLDEEMLKTDREGRSKIADVAKSLDLELPSLCTGLFWKYNLASPDEKIRRKSIELMKQGCSFAADIDASVFLVVPGVATPEIPYKDIWNLSKESLLEAAKVAEDHAVTIGIENVWNKFLYSPLEFRSFVEEINHPNVKVYFDVGNAFLLGYPEQWIKHLADLIVCVHIKDFQISTMQFKPLFQGDIPWQRIMKALSEVGYKGFLNVEVSPYPGHPLKAAMDSKTALDMMLSMI
jgi:hexulose-6-phosphate isomerase